MAVGDPTGVDLASGTTDGDTLPAPWPPTEPEERQITLNTGIKLLSGYKYAIIVRSAGAGSANSSAWQMKAPGAYPGGQRLSSSDSGSTWSGSSEDCWFESYAGGVLKDSYTFAYTGAGANCYDTFWTAQTFTVASTYTATIIKLRLFRVIGATPGTVTVSIRKVEGESYFAPPVDIIAYKRLVVAANNKIFYEAI